MKVPYEGHDGKCDDSAAIPLAGFVSWEKLPENEYAPLLDAIAHKGPVAVSVAANGWDIYLSGIYHGCDRNAIIDHAVTLIGYGKEGDHKYRTLKNSWTKL